MGISIKVNLISVESFDDSREYDTNANTETGDQ
jgi:hypothetical protein